MSESAKAEAQSIEVIPGYDPNQTSVTNKTMRWLGIFITCSVVVLTVLDGFPVFDIDSTIIIAMMPFAAGFFGLGTYRNIQERRIDANAYVDLKKEAPSKAP